MVAFAAAWDAYLANLDAWVEHLGREHDKLLAALAWSRPLRNTSAWRGCEIDVDLWRVRGELGEAERGSTPRSATPRGLRPSCGPRARGWGRPGLGKRRSRRAHGIAELARPLFCPRWSPWRVREPDLLGHVALTREEFQTAQALFNRALELAEEIMRGSGVASSPKRPITSAGRPRRRRPGARCRAIRGGPSSTALTTTRMVWRSVTSTSASRYQGRRLRQRCRIPRPGVPVFREMGFRQYTTRCLEAIAVVAHARGEAATRCDFSARQPHSASCAATLR